MLELYSITYKRKGNGLIGQCGTIKLIDNLFSIIGKTCPEAEGRECSVSGEATSSTKESIYQGVRQEMDMKHVMSTSLP